MQPITLVLFGATGDLAIKKLFPAIASLLEESALHKDSTIIAVSRRNFDTNSFCAFLQENYPNVPDILLEHIEYADVDFDVRRGYENLKTVIDTNKDRELLIYLSLAPQWFPVVIDDLKASEILTKGATKLLLEKPFGTDEASARNLNEKLLSFLSPKQILRVDHYLGKAAVRGMMQTHEQSTSLREIISNKTVARIDVELLETKGIDGRASYDGVGAFRDVGQNHLLETLAVLLAEYPRNPNADAWQDARAKVIESLAVPALQTFRARRGQYAGYETERGVAPESATETAFEIETMFTEGELSGIPVTLRGGKRMGKNYAGIRITFKPLEGFPSEMLFEIQPEARVVLRYAGGRETSIPFTDIHDAYYNVLQDALGGETRHFVGSREIIAAWRYTDALIAQFAHTPLESYSDSCPFFMR